MATNLTATEIVPITGKISDSTLGLDDPTLIEAEEHLDDTQDGSHPNFIESNTSAITIDELTNRNVIPTFSDNTLTISHQNFIDSVICVTKGVFGELTFPECRVSHPIIGRVPSAQYRRQVNLQTMRRPSSIREWLLYVMLRTLHVKSTDRPYISVSAESVPIQKTSSITAIPL